ncbi:MAG: glycoside hydrolase family 5 protein [Candidatus Saccharimonadales bacterium]
MTAKSNQKGFSHTLIILIAAAVVLCILVVAHRVRLKAEQKNQSNQASLNISSNGFVHESGTQLLDGNGKPLKLTGVNFGGWLEWEGWIWGKGLDYIGQTDMMKNLTSLVGSSAANKFQSDVENNYVTQDDFNAVAADGFNYVRIPFNYTMLIDGSGSYKDSGWTILDNALAQAKQAHVYVVLDMQEAPCGQSRIFFAGYTGGPTLWQSNQCQTDTTNLWKAIASRYANDTSLIGYDLLGEPSTSNAQLSSFYKTTTSAIRQVDKNHVLIYEGNKFATDMSVFTGRLDSNQMLSFHAYAWKNNIPSKLAQFDPYSAKFNSPLFIGEYGQAYYPELSQYAQSFMNDKSVAGYSMWTWKQVQELPTIQRINETADSQKLIDWMNNTTRSQPSQEEAQQGISDFINSIKFQNTTTDRVTVQSLTAK